VARVTLDRVRKVYEDSGLVAVHDIDLDVADGELVVLVGPSGCGKSTTLRMIAGLESISSGRLAIGDRVVNDLPPKERDIAMVFQGYALYPHMTVYENMAFALTLRNRPRSEIAARVHRAADMLGLRDVLARRPRHLSGGQRQRVAIGRAIVREPQLFLFDEPLSNLDAQLRGEMRREIGALQRALRTTTIYVTHDQIEAMTLGDRIVVLDAGRVQQIDAPLVLYRSPRNVFVASFIGSPPMNLIPGHLGPAAQADGGPSFRSTDGAITLALPATFLRDRDPTGWRDRPVTLGIRPEHLSVTVAGTQAGEQGLVRAHVEGIEPLGYDAIVHLGVGSTRLVARTTALPKTAIGAMVDVRADIAGLHLFDAASGEAIGDPRSPTRVPSEHSHGDGRQGVYRTAR